MLKIDFKNDWKEFISSEFTRLGLTYEANLDLNQNSKRYFGFVRRLTIPRRRVVYEAPTIVVPPRHQAAYATIKTKIEQSQEIRPYLNTTSVSESVKDALLNEWGIHHLHMGTTLRPDGFMARTGPLIYAKFTNDAAYFLGVFPHGEWENQNLIQIIHDNWPNIITHCKTSLGPQAYTKKERKILRSKNVNSTITVSDGTTYFPPVGLVSSGDSIDDVRSADYVLRYLEKWEADVKNSAEQFYLKANVPVSEDLQVKMMFDEDNPWLYEPVKKIRFRTA
jgi:hypothetical protein